MPVYLHHSLPCSPSRRNWDLLNNFLNRKPPKRATCLFCLSFLSPGAKEVSHQGAEALTQELEKAAQHTDPGPGLHPPRCPPAGARRLLITTSPDKGGETWAQKANSSWTPEQVGEVVPPYLSLGGQRTLLHDVLDHRLASRLLQVAMVGHGTDHLYHSPLHLPRTKGQQGGASQRAPHSATIIWLEHRNLALSSACTCACNYTCTILTVVPAPIPIPAPTPVPALRLYPQTPTCITPTPAHTPTSALHHTCTQLHLHPYWNLHLHLHLHLYWNLHLYLHLHLCLHLTHACSHPYFLHSRLATQAAFSLACRHAHIFRGRPLPPVQHLPPLPGTRLAASLAPNALIPSVQLSAQPWAIGLLFLRVSASHVPSSLALFHPSG